MTEPVSGWDIAEKLWGLLITVAGFFGVRLYLRADKQADEITLLKTTIVGRDEFEAEVFETRRQMESFRKEMVDVMTRSIDRLESSNRQVMTMFNETQNTILDKLLK